MTSRNGWCRRLVAAAAVASTMSGAAAVQDFDQTSCDEFLLPQRTTGGGHVGPVSCMMQETDVSMDGRSFRRLDIGLDGTVEGFTTSAGGTLTNAPALVLPQTGATGPALAAVAKYERNKGASMTAIYPLDPREWNGKLWVTAHGAGVSAAAGTLRPWHRNLDRAKPLHDLNKYDRLILARGYALVKTRRTSAPAAGEVVATLEGEKEEIVPVHLGDSAKYLTDFTALAEAILTRRLGRQPTHTFLYGHGTGGSLGRAINYTAELNTWPDGGRVFDGILADDAAGGGWLPVVFEGQADVLLTGDAARASFVPQIDVTHQLHAAPWARPRPDYVTMSPLANARRNAKILRDKGLASKSRLYEVRGASHEGGENPSADEAVRTLDLSRLMERLIDHLDAWASRAVDPPASRSDWKEVGGDGGDGQVANPAVAFPEIACPLGVYYPYPVTASPQTAFAAFGSPDELEPLDAEDVFVDMNRNGIRDRRETPSQAWRRLGLLGLKDSLTRERYVACVEAAAGRLAEAGFFSDATVRWYTEQARTAAIPDSTQVP